MSDNERRGAGGTAGGLGEFFLGLAMIVIGGYLFFQHLVVSSSLSVLWGRNGSGVALLIVLIGIGFLFFSGRSRIGWILIVVGMIAIFVTVITNLVIYLAPSSFFNTILMFGLIFGGFGLIFRALRPH